MYLLLLIFPLFQIISTSYFYLNTTLQMTVQGKINSIELSYNSMLMIVSLRQPSSDNSSILLYYLNQTSGFSKYNYQLTSVFDDIPGDINFMILSREANILVLGIQHKTIRFYSVYLNGQISFAYQIEGWELGQNQADFSLDTYFVAVAYKNGTISIYSKNVTTIPNQKQTTFSLSYDLFDTIKSNNVPIASLKISPNSSKLYVGYQNSTICIYDLIDFVYKFNMKLLLEDDIVTTIHLSDLGKVMVTGSKRGIIRVYVSDSKGNGLYLSQTFHESIEQIVRIKVATTSLIMLVTNKKGESFQYERMEDTYNWIYNKDKTKRFEEAQQLEMNKYYEKTNQNNTTSYPIFNKSTPKILTPILSADDTIVLNPSLDRESVIIMVSCCATHMQCDTCSNNSICTACTEYYYLNQNSCRRCPNGCMLCRDSQICYRCAPSNYIDLLRGICIPCTRNFPNCRECDGSKRCTKCVQAYELVQNSCELLQEHDQSPNVVVKINRTDESMVEEGVSQKVNEASRAMPIFIIVCLVFLVLLVLSVVFLYYVVRFLKKQNEYEWNNNRLPSSERTISHQ